jgi:hypothetical protein
LSYTLKAGRFFTADKSEKRKWMITTVPFKDVPMLYPLQVSTILPLRCWCSCRRLRGLAITNNSTGTAIQNIRWLNSDSNNLAQNASALHLTILNILLPQF